MSNLDQQPSVADQIRQGLEAAIQHARGEISLKTTVVEIPDQPPTYSPAELTALREKHRLSASDFGQLLNISHKTLRDWEQGIRRPSRIALRLLQVFDRNPAMVLQSVGLRSATDERRNEDRNPPINPTTVS